MDALADKIDALLPQTQCARCGYPDCRAYAEAIARDETGIDRCPPGGTETLQALSTLMQRPTMRLDPKVGTFTPGTVAFIDESLCIGCTKCIQACPVDAIAGAAKQMHTIIESLCTGCELCLPPCPVDCILLQPAQGRTQGLQGWRFPADGDERAAALRGRYRRHGERYKQTAQPVRRESVPPSASLIAERKAEIAAAVARVRAKRAQTKKP
ncbi:MAG TPA: RnfABCDGE type electron transport complex subunit B [Gammaproteobacteria bacterium]|nr:RnfABCDGE type electron transport complex subunit B [Gammaproteobacteria bacterium]